ncbi:MAG: hypothetical protein H7Z72_01195 [Bacteroidetes bacterium]|nr:hypothetical protein [Fibrella sp.]
MKPHYLLAVVLLAQWAAAQNAPVRLDQDPVFVSVLARQIAYPLKAAPGAYARIYAGFSVDAKGRVGKVTILNPVKIGYGFEEEVTLGLKRLPVMNPRYQGDYVLPVLFAYVNYADYAKETVPDGTVPDWYFANRIRLSEIRRENSEPFRERSMRYMRHRDLHQREITPHQ